MNPRSRNERPRIVDGPTERVSSCRQIRPERGRPGTASKSDADAERRGTAPAPQIRQLRRDCSISAARRSPTERTCEWDFGQASGYARRSALSTEKEKKNARGACAAPLAAAGASTSGATSPSPGPCIHFHWHQRAAGLVGRRCPACATWRHAGARGW
jgi:hypothetical protein